MRILPVSSGKGGVGKTTFALNLALALAKTHQTVLIDLDTGTSSLRNFLDVPVSHDLFHFLKKDRPLEECRQVLPLAMDPDRLLPISALSPRRTDLSMISSISAPRSRKN